MAEKRTFSSSVCVKSGAKTMFKIEFFPAEQWQESTQAGGELAGRYRLRINRRWHDLPEGGPAFLDVVQIAVLMASLATGTDPALPAAPDLPRTSVVSVPNGRILAGQTQREVTRTITDPFRAYDGRWHVAVTLYGKGGVIMPVADVIIKG